MLACVDDVMIDIATFTLADYGAHLDDLWACTKNDRNFHFFGSMIDYLETVLLINHAGTYKFLDRCRCGGCIVECKNNNITAQSAAHFTKMYVEDKNSKQSAAYL